MWWLTQVITSPDAQSLRNDFIAEGEQYYWVHVANRPVYRASARQADRSRKRIAGRRLIVDRWLYIRLRKSAFAPSCGGGEASARLASRSVAIWFRETWMCSGHSSKK